MQFLVPRTLLETKQQSLHSARNVVFFSSLTLEIPGIILDYEELNAVFPWPDAKSLHQMMGTVTQDVAGPHGCPGAHSRSHVICRETGGLWS